MRQFAVRLPLEGGAVARRSWSLELVVRIPGSVPLDCLFLPVGSFLWALSRYLQPKRTNRLRQRAIKDGCIAQLVRAFDF